MAFDAPKKFFKLSHTVPHCPEVQVAICPVPAEQADLVQVPQDEISLLVEAQYGPVSEEQVVHDLQPYVGNGIL